MAAVAVIGAGAVGGVIAARLLQRNAHTVTVATRSPLESLEITDGAATIRANPSVLLEPAEANPQDWVLVATKAYDVAGAAKWFDSLVGPQTTVAVLQNGVEHRERFAPYLPDGQLLPVVVDVPAERSAPGVVVQTGPGRLTVPASPGGRRFAELFDGSGIEVIEVDDFITAAWRKLCLNATGAVSALALTAELPSHDPEVADLIHGLVDEAVAVGNSEGASLDAELADEILRGYQQAGRHGINSMLADRLAGRPLETEARNGVIVRLGSAHGIPTPRNAAMVALLRAAAAG